MKNKCVIFTKLRKQQGLGQTEMSKKLGIAQSTLSKIENGKLKPGAEVFSLFGQACGVSLDNLAKSLGYFRPVFG